MRAKKLADLRALEAERLSAELELRTFKAEQRALQAEQAAAELHQRTLQRDYLQFQLEQMQTELAHTLSDMGQMRADLEKQINSLENQIKDIHQTLSWRLTRPFRALHKRCFTQAVSTSSSQQQSGSAPERVPEPELHELHVSHSRQSGSAPERVPEPAPISQSAALDPQKPNLLIICASEIDRPHIELLFNQLPQWQAQYNICALVLATDDPSGRWQQSAYHYVVAPNAKGSYTESSALVAQIDQEQGFEVALMFGLEAKTTLPALAELGVATLAFIDESTARSSSRYALQEVFFGATYTILESPALEEICQSIYPELSMSRLGVFPTEVELSAPSGSWFLDQIVQTRHYHEYDARDAQLLHNSPLFDVVFLGLDPDQRYSRQQITYLYLRSWKAQIEKRKPYAGFHPAIYAQEHALDLAKTDPFAHYLRHQEPQGVWNYPVVTVDNKAADSMLACTEPVALHIHAYYPEMLSEIFTRLGANRICPDLFISVKNKADVAVVQALVAGYKGKVVTIEPVPNVGRDIAPFLTAFGVELVQNYTFIGHLHTKKSLHVTDRQAVEAWQSFLLTCLIGGEKAAMADTILATMQAQPKLGIVFPDDPKVLGWDRNRAFAELLAPDLGMDPNALPDYFNFPAGNMFWLRTELLARFVELDLQWEDYPIEPIGKDATMLHAIERLFGVVPTAMGLDCGVSALSGITR